MKYRVYANNSARENGVPGFSELSAPSIRAAMKKAIDLHFPGATVGGTFQPSAIGTLVWPEFVKSGNVELICRHVGDKLKIERV